MPDFIRDYFRLACLLQQELMRLHKREVAFDVPCWEFERCQLLRRKLRKARSKNFSLAAARVADDLERALYGASQHLTTLAATSRKYSISARIPTLKELYGEVRGLFTEFDAVDYDLKRRQIIVTTEPIELEYVYLGEFEVRLDLNELGKAHPYEIIAKDPHTAAADESPPHPHVRNNRLCEGDGAVPIRRALESGRLADFFQIVTQILHTYNSGSAYAQLEDWSGEQCSDCGLNVAPDDIGSCAKCDSSVCDECLSTCASCDKQVCGGCSSNCHECGQTLCEKCVDSCEDCEEKICPSCLTNRKCKTCHD